MTTLTNSLTKLSNELFPEAKTESEAVFAHQKQLQKIIELKNKFNVPATEDIQLWFELFNAWNELKALELNNGGNNVLANNFSSNININNRLVLVGDQTCGDLSGIL